ncbi:hypothetical protein KL86CLO1_12512 [uncultured Eubacteriales bacterium]|uniref:Uncharacterized protein n=1 Tax=uncultured Eubacteriales bacterium TaxID=172733 RepID=A0A212KAR0_9FIRM|nr:hypothetical protein KL86CLO1_12512 [uncultured Eubacteriales bacterium]
MDGQASNPQNKYAHLESPDNEDKFFSIQVRRHRSGADLASLRFEKNGATVKVYTAKEKTFFIMSNMDDDYRRLWGDSHTMTIATIKASDLPRRLTEMLVTRHAY